VRNNGIDRFVLSVHIKGISTLTFCYNVASGDAEWVNGIDEDFESSERRPPSKKFSQHSFSLDSGAAGGRQVGGDWREYENDIVSVAKRVGGYRLFGGGVNFGSVR